MESESQPEPDSSRQAAFVPKAVERDLIRAALDYLRRSLPPDSGASGAPTVARQKADLCEWAKSLGLLLTPDLFPAIPVRGGQEHDLFHDTVTDRYFKVTRNGIFGLSPGIELAFIGEAQVSINHPVRHFVKRCEDGIVHVLVTEVSFISSSHVIHNKTAFKGTLPLLVQPAAALLGSELIPRRVFVYFVDT
jgi:hypothetical protein